MVHVEPGAGSLIDLPKECLSIIIKFILNQGGTPGDVFKLALVSTGLRSMISEDPVWITCCERQGWSYEQAVSRGEEQPRANGCCNYYCQRMSARLLIRNLLRRLVNFLASSPALGGSQFLSLQAGFFSGASTKMLDAFENMIGIHLPWQIWELWRYHNGQQSSATFANGARLLSLQEVYIDWKTSTPSPAQPALQAEMQGLDIGDVHASEQGDLLQSAHLGHTFRLTSHFSSNRYYCFDLAGRIYLQIGFNRVFVAQDLAGFLQGLLR
eukprot:jgi/Botrbrau1/11522/Bobra.0393s0002.1